jgi:hypothetical protein
MSWRGMTRVETYSDENCCQIAVRFTLGANVTTEDKTPPVVVFIIATGFLAGEGAWESNPPALGSPTPARF